MLATFNSVRKMLFRIIRICFIFQDIVLQIYTLIYLNIIHNLNLVKYYCTLKKTIGHFFTVFIIDINHTIKYTPTNAIIDTRMKYTVGVVRNVT